MRFGSYNYLNINSCYWSACTKPGMSVVMYLCTWCINFASFYNFDIWFWICSDSVVYCVFHVIVQTYISSSQKYKYSPRIRAMNRREEWRWHQDVIHTITIVITDNYTISKTRSDLLVIKHRIQRDYKESQNRFTYLSQFIVC